MTDADDLPTAGESSGALPGSADDPTARLLRQTLEQEAADVHPDPQALQAIHQRVANPDGRTSPRASAWQTASSLESQRSSRTPWFLGAAGAAAATVAVIAAFVVIGNHHGSPSTLPAVGRHQTTQPGGSSHSATSTASPASPAPVSPPLNATATASTVAPARPHSGVYDPNAPASDQVTMYYVGPTGRLYSERHTLSVAPKDTALAATQEWWTSRPIDSDLRPVMAGNTDMRVVGVSTFGQTTTIAIEGPRLPGPRVGVHFLYGGDQVGSAAQLHREDLLLYQALLRTAGVTGEARFTYNGRSVAESNGIRLDPLRVMTDLEVRAFISIDNIVEGQIVHNPVTVSGSANLFEGNLNWDLSDARGQVVKSGHTAAGSMQWKPFAIKLGKLRPGTYTIRAYESSPKNGQPTYVDDKTFTVQ